MFLKFGIIVMILVLLALPHLCNGLDMAAIGTSDMGEIFAPLNLGS
jgi:hypothetical protein